jgi:hypothetical protein
VQTGQAVFTPGNFVIVTITNNWHVAKITGGA